MTASGGFIGRIGNGILAGAAGPCRIGIGILAKGTGPWKDMSLM